MFSYIHSASVQERFMKQKGSIWALAVQGIIPEEEKALRSILDSVPETKNM